MKNMIFATICLIASAFAWASLPPAGTVVNLEPGQETTTYFSDVLNDGNLTIQYINYPRSPFFASVEVEGVLFRSLTTSNGFQSGTTQFESGHYTNQSDPTSWVWDGQLITVTIEVHSYVTKYNSGRAHGYITHYVLDGGNITFN